MERRLQNWARWRLSTKGSPLGYAGIDLESALEGSGSGYDTPSAIPMHDFEASETEAAVMSLPEELWRTLVTFYVGAGSQAKKAKGLGVTERGMLARVDQAHRKLATYFTDKAQQARAERSRVEQLRLTLKGV
jgi:hypothetical protein